MYDSWRYLGPELSFPENKIYSFKALWKKTFELSRFEKTKWFSLGLLVLLLLLGLVGSRCFCLHTKCGIFRRRKNLHEDLAWSWALIWTPPLKYVWIMKILKAVYFCEDTARDFGQVWCYIKVKTTFTLSAMLAEWIKYCSSSGNRSNWKEGYFT